VPLEAGTDGIAASPCTATLELYVRAGMAPAEALQIATWNGARFTGRWGSSARSSPASVADLIPHRRRIPLPTSATSAASAWFMKDGVTYLPSEVYEAIGVKRFWIASFSSRRADAP